MNLSPLRVLRALGLSSLLLSSAACLLKGGIKAYAPAQRPIVAVADFELAPAARKHSAPLGSLADGMISGLLSSGRMRLVERRRLRGVLSEQKLGMAGLVDPETAARVGKLAGAHYVVVGTVLHVDVQDKKTNAGLASTAKRSVELRAEARLIEVSTGLIVAAVEEQSDAGSSRQTALFVKQGKIRPVEDLIAEAAQDLAGRLAESMSLSVPPL